MISPTWKLAQSSLVMHFKAHTPLMQIWLESHWDDSPHITIRRPSEGSSCCGSGSSSHPSYPTSTPVYKCDKQISGKQRNSPLVVSHIHIPALNWKFSVYRWLFSAAIQTSWICRWHSSRNKNITMQNNHTTKNKVQMIQVPYTLFVLPCQSLLY